jgi:hypothetical protein
VGHWQRALSLQLRIVLGRLSISGRRSPNYNFSTHGAPLPRVLFQLLRQRLGRKQVLISQYGNQYL